MSLRIVITLLKQKQATEISRDNGISSCISSDSPGNDLLFQRIPVTFYLRETSERVAENRRWYLRFTKILWNVSNVGGLTITADFLIREGFKNNVQTPR